MTHALSLDDLALLDLLQGFERQEKSKKLGGYTWIDFRTASAQLPCARSLGSVSGVSRAVRRLAEAGLVETRRVDRRVYARSTARCREMLGHPRDAAETPAPHLEGASDGDGPERAHQFPRRWPHVELLDALLVDLAPADADAVVILTVSAHRAGRARSVVDYAAGLARRARDGQLDVATLPAVGPQTLADTRIRASADKPAPSAVTGSSGAAGVAKLRAALGGK